jgi:hypothetical protein
MDIAERGLIWCQRVDSFRGAQQWGLTVRDGGLTVQTPFATVIRAGWSSIRLIYASAIATSDAIRLRRIRNHLVML